MFFSDEGPSLETLDFFYEWNIFNPYLYTA